MNNNIWIIEDQTELAELLRDYLQQAGYRCQHFASGAGVIEQTQRQAPQLILLDLMLPEVDGLTLCREIRRFSNVPIIMTTARVEEIDRLQGLETGADDYICKPYSPREVVARVKTVLRRAQPQPAQASVTKTGLHIDRERYLAEVNGQALELTPVEFRLLATLSQHPEQVHSRDQLIAKVYDDHRIVTDRTVDSHIKNLRKKLAQYLSDEVIQSVYGIGYRYSPSSSNSGQVHQGSPN